MASPLELVEAVLVLLFGPEGEVRGDNRGDRRDGRGGGTEGFLSGEGENRPPLLDDTLGFLSSDPLLGLSEDFRLLSELSFSLLGGFNGELGSLECVPCNVGEEEVFTRDSCLTGGWWGSVLTGPDLNEVEKGRDWVKLGMKLEELESSPNKSLKSLTEGSVLGLKSVSAFTGRLGKLGREGTGGRGRGRAGAGRSKSGSKSACCSLEGAGAGSDGLLDPVGPNPSMDWRDLLSSFGLGGGTLGLEEYPGLGG